MRKLLVVTLAVSFCSIASADAEVNFEGALQRSELKFDSVIVSDKGTALSLKDLELKRNEYARQLEMDVDGLNAKKNFEKAKIEYEKAQIEVASREKLVRQAWDSIKRQRATISSLQARSGEEIAGSGSESL